MFGKDDVSCNLFISRITDYMNNAIKGRYAKTPCAEEIAPMIEAFAQKALNSNVKWDESSVVWHIERIAEILSYVAENTRNYEKLNNEDVASFRKIFDELDALHAETLSLNSQLQYKDALSYKIGCISEILRKNAVGMHDSKEDHNNWRDGMIFQSYENLWRVIHRINTEWEKLCERGFSLDVFYDYWEAFKYDREFGQEMSEENKFETFMSVLDGRKKFVPVYCREYRLLGVKVENNDAEDEIIKISEEKSKSSYRLRQENEEITQCNVTAE